MPATQTTTLGRKWLFKMCIFIAAGVILAAWGALDAGVVYPARGARAAERLEFLYLDAVTERGTRPVMVSFEPVAERDRLAKEAGLGAISAQDKLKLDWLGQLALIGKLGTERITIPDAAARYTELSKTWLTAGGTSGNAVPLASYDIPVQWGICILGAALAGWLTVHVVRVAGRKFCWDPGEKRLTLPDGSSLVPGDIAEFDKRKWDKFLIFLKVKAGHDRLGGREMVLDLYHHAPLEDWVLEMERTAFPENTASAPTEAPPVPAA
ncbi:MAG: hypothetical protein ACKVU4_09980 [Phycisphaerales bacterium]